MVGPLEVESGPFPLQSPWRVAVFFAFFPILFAACALFLLVSGVMVFPACLAWFIYLAAKEELDFFSFPMILQSVAEDLAVFVGLKEQGEFVVTDRGDTGLEENNYYRVLPRTKPVHPRRESFISDFNEPEEGMLNCSSSKEQCYLSPPRIQSTICKISTNNPRRASNYPALSTGTDNRPTPSSTSQSPSPSYYSAESGISIERFIITPEQKLFDFSRTISPHWSVGKPIIKSGTPSPLELSLGELEYLDSYMPSPKRWPSPVSDAGSVTYRAESLRIKLQKATSSEYIEANERVFYADDTGHTHLYEIDTSTQSGINDAQPIDYLPQSHNPLAVPLKLERKLFIANLEDKKSVDPEKPLPEDPIYEKMQNAPLAEYNKETALTIGWSHRYKDLIVELKGSLGKQDSEEENQPKTENFNPINDIDPHWMDFPRLEPLERPRFNKLQRWGLVHTYSKANLKDGADREQSRQNQVLEPGVFLPLETSPFTLKEDYNFGNLEMSPETQGGRSDSNNCEYYRSHWEGFDGTYNINEPKSPRSRSDEEDKWKLSMGKWAEKGVQVMKPVNEESKNSPDGNALISPRSIKAVHWSSPLSDLSEREPLLLNHDSLVMGDENINDSYRLTRTDDSAPRTPSPLLLLGEKADLHEENKETTPLGETSNRLFGRRIARASRLPIAPPPTLTTPPRPLPEKLIRMFEDLSKPQPTSPRPSSLNSSPGRINCSPERSNPFSERNEIFHGSEIRGLGLDLGGASQITPFRETRRKPTLGPKGNDDGLNECF